jgi:hypothetical protein
MNIPKRLPVNLMLVVLLLFGREVAAQVVINGTVYDRSELFPLPGVSVLGTSGAGTVTDSSGHYRIRLSDRDSVYFSYLGKPTQKFPVKGISYPEEFDMSLPVSIDSLQPVYVHSRNYLMDSLETRREYRKIFDYDGPDVLSNMNTGPNTNPGTGINLDLLFDGARNRRMEAFRQRLLFDERENYIDHRFSRYLVKKITGLEPPALDSDKRWYRPSYEYIQSCSQDYEFI